MTVSTEYENIGASTERSVLPPDARHTIYKLGQAIKFRKVKPDQISDFRESLKNIPASAMPKASIEIRQIAGLYEYHYPRPLALGFIKSIDSNTISLLKAYPDLGWILLFHGNGFVRQAALESLGSVPMSKFEYASIAYRLNDWVADVRASAALFANRAFPKTPPSIVGQSSFFLISQAKILSRWTIEERAILENNIYRPDVLEFLKTEFAIIRPGRVGHTLQQILGRPDFDIHLEYLARNASLPSARAISMDALLHGRARWFSGYKIQWIEKVYGVARRVANIQTRALNITVDLQQLLLEAASDKSAHVRKVAADAIIANRDNDIFYGLDETVQKLREDKNAAVRSRAEFYFKKTRTE